MYIIRDAVDHLCGIVGRSRRRPRGERPAVAAIACHFSDGIAEGPLALMICSGMVVMVVLVLVVGRGVSGKLLNNVEEIKGLDCPHS